MPVMKVSTWRSSLKIVQSVSTKHAQFNNVRHVRRKALECATFAMKGLYSTRLQVNAKALSVKSSFASTAAFGGPKYATSASRAMSGIALQACVKMSFARKLTAMSA